MNEETALIPMKEENASQLMRRATDVAGVCKEIVLKTACNIQGKKYVKCEGWMSIATAHGCIASSRDVEKIEGGWRAIGEIKRISDGMVLASAEGFVGTDETKTWGQRPEYACRAMAQTRAISRACRAAFAHVVVLMDCGLSTTPAEEVPDGGFNDSPQPIKTLPAASAGAQKAIPEERFEDLPLGDKAGKSSFVPEPETPSDLPEAIGAVDSVEFKTGKSKKSGKPYTLCTITVNGEAYKTFDEPMAIAAENAKHSKHDVRIIFEEKQDGNYTNRNIRFLTVLDADTIP